MFVWIKQLIENLKKKIAHRKKLKKRLAELKLKDPYDYK
tara:strand:+ start:5989 stop:6105 length:117 start_codon:yes stop_codon:yes gene_type:complete